MKIVVKGGYFSDFDQLFWHIRPTLTEYHVTELDVGLDTEQSLNFTAPDGSNEPVTALLSKELFLEYCTKFFGGAPRIYYTAVDKTKE